MEADGSVTFWDYPAPGSVDFHVPIGPLTRVYDLPAERALVMEARKRPGLKAEIGGQAVELLQVWGGRDGNAGALVRAEYSYPEDYSLQIEGFDTGFRPEKPPFSGQYMVHEPTPDGEQVMFLTRGSGRWKRVPLPGSGDGAASGVLGQAAAGVRDVRGRAGPPDPQRLLVLPAALPAEQRVLLGAADGCRGDDDAGGRRVGRSPAGP